MQKQINLSFSYFVHRYTPAAPTNIIPPAQELALPSLSNSMSMATKTLEPTAPDAATNAVPIRNIPTSQINSIYNVDDSVNNLSSMVDNSKIPTDSIDLYQQQPLDSLPLSRHQLTKSNLVYEPSIDNHTLQRLTTLPPQKQYSINATVPSQPANITHTIAATVANSPPSTQLYSNRALQYDATALSTTSPLVMNSHHSQLPSPKIINRDIFLNGNRFSNNLGARHNGVHRKYSDTDIVGEMNQLYKQSMFVRRTGIDDDPSPFQHCTGPSPMHRETAFNRFGYDTANRRKIGSPLVNRKLSPPFESNWNIQRHSPNYQYGGSISATPSPNLGGRKLTTSKPVYWDSQHVRLQGNTSPIGEKSICDEFANSEQALIIICPEFIDISYSFLFFSAPTILPSTKSIA